MLCKKSEVLEAYKSFEVWVIAQEHCNAIKILGSDCRGEYLSCNALTGVKARRWRVGDFES